MSKFLYLPFVCIGHKFFPAPRTTNMKLIPSILGLCCLAISSSKAIKLTNANWDKETSGKILFVTFYFSWDGHWKAMTPAWEKLEAEYQGSETVVIGKGES